MLRLLSTMRFRERDPAAPPGLKVVVDLEDTLLCIYSQELYWLPDKADLVVNYKDGAHDAVYVRPGARRFLDALRDGGASVVLWSTGPLERARRCAEEALRWDHFDLVLSGADLDARRLKDLDRVPARNTRDVVLVDDSVTQCIHSCSRGYRATVVAPYKAHGECAEGDTALRQVVNSWLGAELHKKETDP